MNKKIVADSWIIMWHGNMDLPFHASIDYSLGDERNKKSHRFGTFQEAYKWIENQVDLEPKKTSS